MSGASGRQDDTERVRSSRPRAALRIGVAIALLGASGWWGLGPIRVSEIRRPDLAAAAAPPAAPTSLAALDTASFHAPLWVAPPAPPPPPPAPRPPPPAPPLRLQLLAILREESGGLRAVLYDPDADSLVFASEGQVLQGRTVQKIADDAVDLMDHGSVRRLALRDDSAQPAGGSP